MSSALNAKSLLFCQLYETVEPSGVYVVELVVSISTTGLKLIFPSVNASPASFNHVSTLAIVLQRYPGYVPFASSTTQLPWLSLPSLWPANETYEL